MPESSIGSYCIYMPGLIFRHFLSMLPVSCRPCPLMYRVKA